PPICGVQGIALSGAVGIAIAGTSEGLDFTASCVSECFGGRGRRALTVYVSIGSKRVWNTKSVPAWAPCSARRAGRNPWNLWRPLPHGRSSLGGSRSPAPPDRAGSANGTRNRPTRLARHTTSLVASVRARRVLQHAPRLDRSI